MKLTRLVSPALAARLPVLLALSVVLVLLLAWQAQRAAAAHRTLAARVLHDYTDIAATELSRRATSYIGNYGFGAAIRGLSRAATATASTTAPAWAPQPAAAPATPTAARATLGSLPSRKALAAAIPEQSRRAVELTALRFAFDPATVSGDFEIADGTLSDAARQALLAAARRPADRPSDYRVLPFAGDGRLRLFVFTASGVAAPAPVAPAGISASTDRSSAARFSAARFSAARPSATGSSTTGSAARPAARAATRPPAPRAASPAPPPAPDRRVGFEVDLPAVAHWFDEFILSTPLLPPALAARDAAGSAVRVQVRTPDGGLLLRRPDSPWPDAADTIRRPLDDAADNSLRGFIADVAIDPAAAEALVIGGLPASRAGLLLALLILSLGLTAAAAIQIVREQALARLRQEFVTRTSHELRTPIAQIRMFTDTLLLDRVRSEEERRRSLEAIDRGARRLAHLVDNVMQFARRESRSNGTRPAPVDVTQLAREAMDELEAMLAHAPAMTLDAASPLHARIDPEAFRQILMNLLDNAVKYGRRHDRDDAIHVRIRQRDSLVRDRLALDAAAHASAPAPARVSAGESERQGTSESGSEGEREGANESESKSESKSKRESDTTAEDAGAAVGVNASGRHLEIELSVEDRGPGIPPRDRDRVWLPYVRLDRDRASAVAGAGIGLAVVRDLVDLHHGRVRIDAPAAGGTRIVVTLPASEAGRA